MIILENEELKLRAIEPEDLDNLYEWENDSHAWDSGNTRSPYSKLQLRTYIANLSYDIYENQSLRLMIEEKASKLAIGSIDLFDFDLFHNRIAIGVFIAPEFRQKGLAKNALKLIEEYVFDFLKINQIYVHVAIDNIASRKLFENRYTNYGTLKQWIKTMDGYKDVLTYQLFLDEYNIQKNS